MFISDGLCRQAGADEPGEHGCLHGAAVQSVVEFGNVALQVFRLDLVVCAEQESLQVRQGNVDPWEEAVRRLILLGYGRCGVFEALSFSVAYSHASRR